MSRITPCLWFNNNAEEAARFYVSVFKQSRLGTITRYGEPGAEVSGRPKGSVMTATFEIDGQEFVALNGGPTFYTGGNTQAQQCGWLKDRYGVSWQIVPTVLIEMLKDGDPRKANRVMQAVFQMKQIDIPTLQNAYEEKV